MTNPIDNFLQAIDDTIASTEGASQQLSAEYVSAMNTVGKAVENWCGENNLIEHKEVAGIDVCAASEAFKCDMIEGTLGAEKIIDLCKKAHVAQEHLGAAAKRVACLLAQTVGRKASASFGEYGSRKVTDKTLLSVESLYSASLMSQLKTTASLETFGINMDRVEPDLKTILTIALLQFHTNLTPRIVPIQTVTQGNVTIVRESMEIFDLTKPKDKPTRVIELYKDPAMVTVRAQRIKPLASNDASSTFLLADDVYKFNKAINMFELAKDSTKPGWEAYNHTDFVEDNIVLDGVLLKIEYTTTVESVVTKKYYYTVLPIPASRGRLTQFTNDLASTDRRLALDRFPARIDKNAPQQTLVSSLTSDAAAVAELQNGVGLAIDLHVNCHVDRRTAMLDATAWLGDLAIKGGSLSDTQRAELLAKYTSVEILGFTLDARYNEDNKRKTSIRAEMKRRSMSYELPSGRNFVIDSAIGQDGVLNAAARLAQLEHIGRDYNNLKIVEETLKSVHDQNVSMNNDAEAQASLAAQYAAGDLVNPYVYMDTFDLRQMYGVRSADASGDTKQFIKTYFNRLTSELMLKTLFQQQLAEGAPVVFRLITSPTILGELFCLKHIHQHLENDSEGTGGVEHVINLDNGVRLEVVTTTFTSMTDKIILIPYLANSQASVLNFGTDFDQGTLVGALSVASDGGPAYNRLFSTTRELLIPTNVMGAIVDVVGNASTMAAGQAAFIPTDDVNALTVLGVNAK